MKQWILGEQPGIANLQQVEVEQPQPGAGEVLVRLRAGSLNYRDLLAAKGQYGGGKHLAGLIPLSDGAGEVVALGEGVTQWKIGDRVAGTFFQEWRWGRFDAKYHKSALGGDLDGVLREYATFPVHGLVSLPGHFSFEEGATLPCAGLTAWYAPTTRGGFQPGDSVLLQGTGGVSIWGLQIAVASSGQAIITSSSDEKLERAKALGASETINYKTSPDWDKEIGRLTNKRGVDHILEVGGPGTLGLSLNSVAAGGTISQIGVLTGFGSPGVSLFPLVGRNANLHGIYVGDRESFENFVRFLNVTKIHPVIDRTFTFDEAKEAYRFMESGSHFGKIVISI